MTLRIEKEKFDIVELVNNIPNDIVDILKYKNIVICICYDYIYIINMMSYKKVVYFFNKTSYINEIFELMKDNCLFVDYTYFNINFSILNVHTKNNNIFLLNKKYMIHGHISKDRSLHLVYLVLI